MAVRELMRDGIVEGRRSMVVILTILVVVIASGGRPLLGGGRASKSTCHLSSSCAVDCCVW